ncbi:MAG: sigma-54 dependent transcriptional regulator [Phycisphaerae bacterium]
MKSLGTILLAEDDRSVLQAIGDALEDSGYHVLRAGNGAQALLKLSADVDVLITDLWMPNMDGLALLEQVKAQEPLVEIIMITGNATVASAVAAMKAGAFDYLTKPFTPPELLEVVARALEHHRMRVDMTQWREQNKTESQIANLIGTSESMLHIYDTIRRVAGFKSTVLVSGESGTGKEMVVRAIHELSPRKAGPFIPINCAAVPASLMESELFGHERGAFTGAASKTVGYFEAAHGGTLFIDEVGELELGLQAKLLRVLETGKITPVGSTQEKSVDVRVLAATNADLQQCVDAKRFRPDLYYRLNVVRIDIPPLRERTSDIPMLAQSLLQKLCLEHGLDLPVIEEITMQRLQTYGWPGNVRELRNVLESVLILNSGNTITETMLPEHVRRAQVDDAMLPELDVAEREAIDKAIKQASGDRTRAAVLLGVSVRTLYRKMARYGLH